MSTHAVGRALAAAADGSFPPVDGGWEVVDAWRPGIAAIVSFTGHAFVAVDGAVVPATIADRLGGYGEAHDPRIAVELAGADGFIDSLDAVLVTRGRGGRAELVERPDLREHPRAVFARRIRGDVRCLGSATGRSLVTIGVGIGGLTELGVAVEPGEAVSGRELIAAALTGIPPSQTVVAAVAPGNARALRAFLAAGFVPVAGVQVIVPRPQGAVRDPR